MKNLFQTPILTRQRIWLAFAVAIIGDGIQLILAPAGWFGVDQVIDVITMLLATLLLGFHPLFLPTFLAEFIPGVDMVPTWTGCIAVVIALRRKQQQPNPSPAPARSSADVIDV
jgi:hypothetical protein